jgi:hypothetical protein
MLIYRGGVIKDDEADPTVSGNSFLGIGPVLYTLEGMQMDSSGLGSSAWISKYTMTLFCMKHPELISGKGLEVGR